MIDNNRNDLIVGCRKRFENLIEIFIKVRNSDGLFLKIARILSQHYNKKESRPHN